ncbi:MAG: CRTAC1 family protein [Acidobacteria bacterium]|nr:CRTAC1 family protein [Acidobacteriota bacterium]
MRFTIIFAIAAAATTITLWLPMAVSAPGSHSGVHFRDIARVAGLTTLPPSSPYKRYLIETMGGGVALFDCDNDGKLDILVTGDSTIEHYLQGGDPMLLLYHQDSDLKFSDITRSAGLTTRGWGMGVAVGDYDNDGLPDIYVTGYGHNALYHNLGGCRFQDVTEQAHVGGGGFSVGAAWADYDGDGHLDLFVARYVHSDIHHLPPTGSPAFNYKGLPIEVPGTEGETSLLYHNRGDGTFEELSEKAGVHNAEKRRGMAVTWSDYDNDGWPDLFVANDMDANYLYHNKHDGTFEEVGMLTGTAVDSSGLELGNMAGDFGDYDRDGRLDLMVTRFGNQPISLYHNEAERGFTDLAWEAKLAALSSSPVKWGGGFADFENNGWLDIFVANGNVSPKVDQLPHEAPFREPIQLFRNLRGNSFEEIGRVAGFNDGTQQSRRGTAFGDLNNDGRVDVVVYNIGAPPSLFINESINSYHRVLFKLIGGKTNRGAVGARVTVETAHGTQVAEVRAGGSYLSSNDQRLHFGLGDDAMIDKVTVRWPGGATDQFRNLAADSIYTVVESRGIQGSTKFNRTQEPRKP